MRTTIKAKVHLLEVDNRSNILEFVNKLAYNEKGFEEDIACRHLYFTTDEEIKKGNFAINLNSKTIFKITEVHKDGYTGKKLSSNNISYGLGKTLEKIVATTDSELWDHPFRDEVKENGRIGRIQLVPKIDIPFIEAYIKAYNEGKPIIEVLLETSNIGSPYEISFNSGNVMTEKELKLKPNGSVIVHPVKEKMFTKKELYSAIYLAFISGHANPQLKPEQLELFINNWFNQNYPE